MLTDYPNADPKLMTQAKQTPARGAGGDGDARGGHRQLLRQQGELGGDHCALPDGGRRLPAVQPYG